MLPTQVKASFQNFYYLKTHISPRRKVGNTFLLQVSNESLLLPCRDRTKVYHKVDLLEVPQLGVEYRQSERKECFDEDTSSLKRVGNDDVAYVEYFIKVLGLMQCLPLLF